MYADLPPLGFSTRKTAGRMPVAQGKCQANLQNPGSSNIVPSPSPPPTQNHKMVTCVVPPCNYLSFYPTQFIDAFSTRGHITKTGVKALYIIYRNKHE